MELGPEATKLWDRLEAMKTKNFKANWGDGSYETVEAKAKLYNYALDQIENGTAHTLTDEELEGI